MESNFILCVSSNFLNFGVVKILNIVLVFILICSLEYNISTMSHFGIPFWESGITFFFLYIFINIHIYIYKLFVKTHIIY